MFLDRYRPDPPLQGTSSSEGYRTATIVLGLIAAIERRSRRLKQPARSLKTLPIKTANALKRDGALMEPSGCNRWQPVANATA
jgi:hypothetical protein